MDQKSLSKVMTALIILSLAVAVVAINVPVNARAASATAMNPGPGFGTSGTSYGGFSGSPAGWVREYKEILSTGLNPFSHCYVGYEVGRVPLYSSGYYGYGPWRRPP